MSHAPRFVQALLSRRTLFAGVLAAGTATAALLGGAAPALAQGKGTLTIGIETDLARLDPHISGTWNIFKALSHIYART